MLFTLEGTTEAFCLTAEKFRVGQPPPARWLGLRTSGAVTIEVVDAPAGAGPTRQQVLRTRINALAERTPPEGWTRSEIAMQLGVHREDKTLQRALLDVRTKDGWEHRGNRYWPPDEETEGQTRHAPMGGLSSLPATWMDPANAAPERNE